MGIEFPTAITPVHTDEETSSTHSDGHDVVSVQNTFEGPEKNLEIDFKSGVGHPNGFRQVQRNALDEMLTAGQCQILSKTSNEHIDAYVLSESSLFVYTNKVVIKTCGTTTLLKCLPLIKQYAEELGMEFEWVSYSRKNYKYPESQVYPHQSFQTEVEFLTSYFPDGSAHALGPLNSDHWYVYVWDYTNHLSIPRPISYSSNTSIKSKASESTLQILMQGMHPSVAKKFFKNQVVGGKTRSISSEEMTIESGIHQLVPGAVIDAFAFDPCGYSMNGILFDAYYTIHITPESHCSYVSFETNARLRCYESLLKNVVRCFKPEKYSVTVYADRDALEVSKSDIFKTEHWTMDSGWTYQRKSGNTQATFEGDYLCLMANYALVNLADQFSKSNIKDQKVPRRGSFA